MQAFVNNGFKNADLKALNYVRKFIQSVTLADIANTDGRRISHRSYDAVESNRLRKELRWPKVPDELPLPFITLWKAALNKCFVNHSSSTDQRIVNGLYLRDWLDQINGSGGLSQKKLNIPTDRRKLGLLFSKTAPLLPE